MKKKLYVSGLVAVLILSLVAVVVVIKNSNRPSRVEQPTSQASVPVTDHQVLATTAGFVFQPDVDNQFEERDISLADEQGLPKRASYYQTTPLKLTVDANNDLALIDMTDASTFRVIDSIKEEILGGAFDVDDDGTLWVLKYHTTLKKVTVTGFDQDNRQVEQIVLADSSAKVYDNQYIWAVRLAVGKDYICTLYDQAIDGGKSYTCTDVFKRDGTKIRHYPMVNDFTMDSEQNIYIIPAVCQSSTLPIKSVVKLTLGTTEQDDKWLTSSDAHTYSFFCKPPQSPYLYCLNYDGITLYDSEHLSLIDEDFNWQRDANCDLNNRYFSDFIADLRGNYYISIQERSQVKLQRLAYLRTVDVNKPQVATLSITTPYKDSFIENVIMRYEKAYPTQKVDYQYTFNTDYDFFKQREKFIRDQTTKLLTNQASDILMISSEYVNVANSDALVDLSDLLKSDKNYSNLYTNIVEGMTFGAQIKAVPINTTYRYYHVNHALAQSLGISDNYNALKWRDILELLDTLSQQLPDYYMFSMYQGYSDNPYEVLLIDLLSANLPDLIDIENKTVNLKAKWFTDLLKQFKSATQKPNFIGYHRVDQLFNSRGEINNRQANGLFRLGDLTEASMGDCLYRYVEHNKRYGDNRAIPIFSGELAGHRTTINRNSYAINAATDNLQNAQRFILFMLQTDVMTSGGMQAAPINKIACQAMYQNAFEKRGYGKDGEKGSDGSLAQRYVDEHENIKLQIEHGYYMGWLMNDVMNPIIDYCNDKLTLEQAIEQASDNAIRRLYE